MVVQVLAEDRPEFLEQEGRGDDGRAGVEAKAAMRNDAAASAELVEPIEQGDALSQGARSQGCRHAAEAGADDDGFASVIGHRGSVALARLSEWLKGG